MRLFRLHQASAGRAPTPARRLTTALALVAFAAALSASGCSSSGGTQGDRSDAIVLRLPAGYNSDIASQMRLTLRATTVCADAGCVGRGYYLLVANAGRSELYLNYSPVRIVVGDETFEWPNVGSTTERQSAAVGAFLRLPLDEPRFRRFAEAFAAEVWLGSTKFELSRDDRAPLRALLAGS